MDMINALIEGLTLEEVIPPLTDVLAYLEPVVKWAVMAGPIVVLVLGLIYLLVPPKEANHHLGFRTFFGMGSIEAWRFTQLVAGISLSVLGLGMTIVMYVITKGFAGMDHYDMIHKAATCLLWELGLIGLFYVGISVVACVFFNKDGERRWKK